MASWIIQMMVMMVSIFIKASHGKRDPVLYCSACRAIVDELNYSISQVDPRKTIDVGGFRVNPDGSVKNKQVPLARSETHLSELLEEVCKSMSDYALHLDPDTQQKQYRRFAPRSTGTDGGFPDLKNFQFDGPEASTGLAFACETLVEELEDDIISTFSKKADGVEEQLCSSLCDRSGSRTNQEL
ncbi:Protein canopy-1 [Oryzias melastigma]|uniref:Canopy FGF signaling regulator 1 n=1 Tax=Oryzias melastigma TaxID=30732 RepID=A0A3B3D0P8_ORYME|nr:protein canopy-1 [Oryzias melastigma]KAF6720253.1 Protein canopy-1 [Oryzias melastigma]